MPPKVRYLNDVSKRLLTPVWSAHQQAHDQAQILHRDISAGNIMISDTGEGLLIDWDSAKHLDDIEKGGSQPERTVRRTHCPTARVSHFTFPAGHISVPGSSVC